MIFMEERILFPTALRKLPETAWAEIRRGEGEIGYAWVKPGNLWDPNVVTARAARNAPETAAPASSGTAAPGGAADATHASGAEPRPAAGGSQPVPLPLDVGELLPAQINLMLKTLPVDITFVDEKDKVRYYSGTADRIFPRSPGIIGRDVGNCHPPKSVHVVERIVSAFRKGERKSAEFWFTLNDRFLFVRYFAVYNEHGNYRGTVEVSQDVTDIRALAGERKLLDWDS